MSTRHSTRASAQADDIGDDLANGYVESRAPSKKRARLSASTEAIATEAVAQDGMSTDAGAAKAAMPPPPATPNKRRRVAETTEPPPFTPTPSAIGVMLGSGNYSTGDIDDATPPPPTRRVEPHHTNATLVTPRGTQVASTYSNFEESPSKPQIIPSATTTKTLLDHACAHLIAADERMRLLIAKHPCRIFSPEGLAEKVDPFRSLASGIMAQQVSGAAAKAIKNKFIALYKPEECPNGFPLPAVVSCTTIVKLRTAGLSQRKAEYIQGLAGMFDSGELTVAMLMNGSDEEVMEKLVAVRGLGRWSVEMFMCFGLKRTDVFSTGDLGVQRGMAAFVGKDVAKLKNKGGKWKYMAEKDMVEMSAKFSPYKSLFMWYMWRVEDVDVDAIQDNDGA